MSKQLTEEQTVKILGLNTGDVLSVYSGINGRGGKRCEPYVPAGLTLRLANKAQVVLFNEELAGQISDGVWENSKPYNHYKWVPGRDKVSVAKKDELVGLFYDATYGGELHKDMRFTPPRRYNFCNSLLIEVCGERMIEAVEKAVGCVYSLKQLKKDFRSISEVVNWNGLQR